MEFLREVAHLRPRTPTSSGGDACGIPWPSDPRFFDEQGFVWIATRSPSRRRGRARFRLTLDKEHFFGREVPTVSGQLNVGPMPGDEQSTPGPTFRAGAEHQPAPRRVLDDRPEIALQISPMTRPAESLKVFFFSLEERPEDMAFFDEGSKKASSRSCGHRRHRVRAHGLRGAIATSRALEGEFEFPVRVGHGPAVEHERWLTEKHAKKPVIVMNYRRASGRSHAGERRRQDRGGDGRARPGISEIIGGSQRERLDVLDARMAKSASIRNTWAGTGICAAATAHAGFGLGFEHHRLSPACQRRDVIPFPRRRATPY
jgi:asparaginyl-tRNA synthetase